MTPVLAATLATTRPPAVVEVTTPKLIVLPVAVLAYKSTAVGLTAPSPCVNAFGVPYVELITPKVALEVSARFNEVLVDEVVGVIDVITAGFDIERVNDPEDIPVKF